MDYAETVQFFFDRQPILDGDNKIYSTLCLILNDIKTCVDMKILAFPRAMCLMTAIDLLGKMSEGKDTNKSGDRFENWLEKFVPNVTGKQIYAFRNAMHHSYQMPTTWKPDGTKNSLADLRFRLIEAPEKDWPTCTLNTDSIIFVNLPSLEKNVMDGIRKYNCECIRESNPEKQHSFLKMFEKYGSLSIGQINLSDLCDSVWGDLETPK